MIRFQRLAGNFRFRLACQIIALLTLSFLTTLNSLAVILSWDPNPESNIAGYRVHYGTSSGNYSQTIDVGNTTNASISSLLPGTTYYFAVTAYNALSLESVVSTETSFTAGANEVQASGMLANGSFQLNVAGGKGRVNTVQVSSDLKTWTNLTNLFNTNGSLFVADAAAAGLSRRFYRVWAESYYLSNVVGFANVSVPSGYSIVANPFAPYTNTIATVFANVPAGTTVFKFQPHTGDFAVNSYDGDFQEWQAPTQPFGNGEGAFVLNPTATSFKVTFAGRVPEGSVAQVLPAGYSMVGSMLPQEGLLQTELGFKPTGGETVFLFRNGNYQISQFDPDFHQWDAEPQINIGEGFFLSQPQASVWPRVFAATF